MPEGEPACLRCRVGGFVQRHFSDRNTAYAPNMAVSADAFVDARKQNYALAKGAPAQDAGTPLALVKTHRGGMRRPRATSLDVGAFEQ